MIDHKKLLKLFEGKDIDTAYDLDKLKHAIRKIHKKDKEIEEIFKNQNISEIAKEYYQFR